MGVTVIHKKSQNKREVETVLSASEYKQLTQQEAAQEAAAYSGSLSSLTVSQQGGTRHTVARYNASALSIEYYNQDLEENNHRRKRKKIRARKKGREEKRRLAFAEELSPEHFTLLG